MAQTIEAFVGNALDDAKISPLHKRVVGLIAAGYFFDVITNGFGAMQGYAEQIPPRDRWMIAAYVRALQLSQSATVDDVPAADRSRLGEPASPAPAPRAER